MDDLARALFDGIRREQARKEAAMEALNRAEKRPTLRGPFAPEYVRPERSTRPAHRDPTGQTAVGNLMKEEKK